MAAVDLKVHFWWLQASVFFINPKTALVTCYLYVFATGLLASLLLATYMGVDAWWVNIVEIVPAFAVFRGLYIMGEYAFLASYQGSKGLTFGEFNSDGNGTPLVHKTEAHVVIISPQIDNCMR